MNETIWLVIELVRHILPIHILIKFGGDRTNAFKVIDRTIPISTWSRYYANYYTFWTSLMMMWQRLLKLFSWQHTGHCPPARPQWAISHFDTMFSTLFNYWTFIWREFQTVFRYVFKVVHLLHVRGMMERVTDLLVLSRIAIIMRNFIMINMGKGKWSMSNGSCISLYRSISSKKGFTNNWCFDNSIILWLKESLFINPELGHVLPILSPVPWERFIS